MKHHLILPIVFLLTAPTAAIAKEEKPGMTDRRLTKMQEQVQLSDEQVAKMREIRESGGNRSEMRAVLTEEQAAQLKQLRMEARKAKAEDGAET